MFFSTSKLKVVKQATVEFSESKKTLQWSETDGNLLDFAESAGISAMSSCRNGHCGACSVELIAGQVVYEQDVSADLQGNQILLCSAKPASKHIKIKI
jgi:ferredoxin